MQALKNRNNLSGEVYDYVKKNILEGRFSPGEKLSEERIAEKLGISRTPVREAFNQLAREMAIDLIPRRGCYVRSFTREQVIDIFEVRKALEAFAIKKIISQGKAAVFKKLHEECLSLAKSKPTEANVKKLSQADLKFHALLAKESNNSLLEKTLNDLHGWLRKFFDITEDKTDFYENLFKNIALRTEAILKGDEGKAVRESSMHLEASCQYILKSSKLLVQ